MATTRAGRLTFDVDADGTILERSLRAIGRRAGVAGGNEFETSFGRRLNQSGGRLQALADRIGSRIGTSLTNGMNKAGTGIERFRDRFTRTGTRIGDAIENGFNRGRDSIIRFNHVLSESDTRFDHFNRTASNPHVFNDLTNLLAKGRNSLRDFGGGLDDGGRKFTGFQKNLGSNGRLIKSHVGRVIALWTGLVLAIGEGTASLGSGVGAALTSVIGTLAVGLVGALGIGGAALAGFAVQATLAVAALQRMKDIVPGFQDSLDNLTAAWENAGNQVAEIWGPSVIAFLDQITAMLNNPALLGAMATSLAAITDAFTAVLQGPGFSQLVDALTNIIPGALTDLGGGFASIFGGLASVFAAAAPALAIFADQFNTFWDNWADRMAEGTADGSLQEFFLLALDSINAVFGVVGALAGALSTLFTTAAPYGNEFLGIIEGLFEQWDTWMKSIEGQQSLQTWFEQGLEIMQAVFDLAGQLGAVLGALVTPESVERLLNFIDGLADFLPTAGLILEFFGKLDILGIFVGLLGLITDLLTPLMPTLLTLAETVGVAIVGAFEQWGPKITGIGEALAPVVQVLAVIIEAVLPALIDIISSVIDYITSFVEAIVGADADSVEFKQTIEIVGMIVGDVFKVMGALIGAVLEGVGGALKIVSQLLRGDFSGAFDTAYQVASSVMDKLGWDIDELVNFFEDMGRNIDNIMGDIGDAIGDFGDGVADVFGGVIGWISDAIGWFGSLFGAANDANSAASNARSAGGGGGFAAGGILNGPRRILAGEAGPEAIVPLRRTLSMVDPSVRWLSAIAQGGPMASGGIVGGGGKSLNVAPGAIVVQEVGDGRRTANNVLTRLVEYAAG